MSATLLAALADARTGRIPDALTLPALAFGLVVGSPGGAAVCALPALWLFARGKLGGGDVKLLAALGALLGPGALLVEVLAIGAALAAGSRRLGPWIAAATVGYALLSNRARSDAAMLSATLWR